jgi:hypothetical protein
MRKKRTILIGAFGLVVFVVVVYLGIAIHGEPEEQSRVETPSEKAS